MTPDIELAYLQLLRDSIERQRATDLRRILRDGRACANPDGTIYLTGPEFEALVDPEGLTTKPDLVLDVNGAAVDLEPGQVPTW